MFKLSRILTKSKLTSLGALQLVQSVPNIQNRFYAAHEESYEELDKRMLEFFKRKDLDHWWVRKGLQELHGVDVVPEPHVIIEALHAIRRINDFALAIRFLEAIKLKCGKRGEKTVWPYVLSEIQPTLSKLGIPTPQEIGYDKPELALKDAYLD